jgi:hypothetical protein
MQHPAVSPPDHHATVQPRAGSTDFSVFGTPLEAKGSGRPIAVGACILSAAWSFDANSDWHLRARGGPSASLRLQRRPRDSEDADTNPIQQECWHDGWRNRFALQPRNGRRQETPTSLDTHAGDGSSQQCTGRIAGLTGRWHASSGSVMLDINRIGAGARSPPRCDAVGGTRNSAAGTAARGRAGIAYMAKDGLCLGPGTPQPVG